MKFGRLILALLLAAANPHTHSAACCKAEPGRASCCQTEHGAKAAARGFCGFQPANAETSGCCGVASNASEPESAPTCRDCPCCQNQPLPIAPPAAGPESKLKSAAPDAWATLPTPLAPEIAIAAPTRAALPQSLDSHQRRQARLAVWLN